MSEVPWYSLKEYDRKEISAGKFNRLVEVVQSIALGNGLNYRIKRTPAGTTLVTTGKAALAGSCPFGVTVKPGESSSDLIANIRAGTVNQLLPSNNFADFHFDPSTVVQVKAHVLTDGQKVTSCSLVVDSNNPAIQTPTPFALPSTVDVLIAVIVGGIPYRVLGCGSIQLTGGQQFVTDKDPPAAPGTSNITNWYSWIVGTV